MLYAVAQVAPTQAVDPSKAKNSAENIAQAVISKWKAFEADVQSKATNSKYKIGGSFNFDGYYKGVTVADDIKSFSWI